MGKAHSSAVAKHEAGKIAEDRADSGLKVAMEVVKEAKAAIANVEGDMKSAAKEFLFAKGRKQSFADGASASYNILKEKVMPISQPVQHEPAAGSEEASQVGVPVAASGGATK